MAVHVSPLIDHGGDGFPRFAPLGGDADQHRSQLLAERGSPPAAASAPTLPSDTGSLDERDVAVLVQLTNAGADLRASRNVRHYVYFPSEDAARVAAGAAEASGYSDGKRR